VWQRSKLEFELSVSAILEAGQASFKTKRSVAGKDHRYGKQP
jgi:hypothetical protein